MPKKNPINKFNQINWKLWIGVIIVLFFLYFILNLGVWQILWVAIIILIGTSIVQSVQKSSIGDYWKISWTILGIVAILLLVFFSVKNFSLENTTEGRIKMSLQDDNYEVLEVNYFEEFLGNESLASVHMKSFGDLNEQARDGLTRLGIYYKNADSYSVTIFTPTSKCYYSIDGAILNPYLNEDELDETAIIESLDFQIWENYILNKEPDFYDISLYKNIDETGFDSLILSSIIDYKIELETKSCS